MGRGENLHLFVYLLTAKNETKQFAFIILLNPQTILMRLVLAWFSINTGSLMVF